MCLKITYILFLKPFILVFGKVSTMYLSMWIEAECDSLFTDLFHHLTLSHLFWREKVWGSSFPRGTGRMLGECSCCDTRPILLTEMFPLSFWCLRGLERGRIKHSKCWEVCKWDFWKVREREIPQFPCFPLLWRWSFAVTEVFEHDTPCQAISRPTWSPLKPHFVLWKRVISSLPSVEN